MRSHRHGQLDRSRSFVTRSRRRCPCLRRGKLRVMSTTVQPLDREAAGELLTLQRASFVTEAQLYDDPNLLALRQTLDEVTAELDDPAVICLGIRDEHGRLIASIRARIARETADVAQLVVAPDQQGHGFGTQLLTELERRLPAQVTTLRLYTGDRSDGNLRLYRRAGFKETHREPTSTAFHHVHMTKQRSRP
jgi:ribosomal protein S18 acetylase RimI-like enzyme